VLVQQVGLVALMEVSMSQHSSHQFHKRANDLCLFQKLFDQGMARQEDLLKCKHLAAPVGR
jgi:hypothetical protein